jgi:hypothetical protein
MEYGFIIRERIGYVKISGTGCDVTWYKPDGDIDEMERLVTFNDLPIRITLADGYEHERSMFTPWLVPLINMDMSTIHIHVVDSIFSNTGEYEIWFSIKEVPRLFFKLTSHRDSIDKIKFEEQLPFSCSARYDFLVPEQMNELLKKIKSHPKLRLHFLLG